MAYDAASGRRRLCGEDPSPEGLPPHRVALGLGRVRPSCMRSLRLRVILPNLV